MPIFDSGIFDTGIFDSVSGTNAGVATGTGVAGGASGSTGISAGAASGSGAAYPATVGTTSSATAAAASGSGASAGPATAIGAAARLASGSGAAQGATVSTAVSAAAGYSSGVGAARDAYIPSDHPRTYPAASAGSSLGARGASSPTAQKPSGAGAARDAVVVPTWIAQAASGAGAAYTALINPTYAPAETASALGTALDATTLGSTPRPLVIAGTGEAWQARGVSSSLALARSLDDASVVIDPIGPVAVRGDITTMSPVSGEFGFGEWLYAGYVRLDLSVDTGIYIDTFGSGIYDTYLDLYTYPPDAPWGTSFIDEYDDTYVGAFRAQYLWSSGPRGLFTEAPLALTAGSYFLIIHPNWDLQPDDLPIQQITITPAGSIAAHPLWESYVFVDSLYTIFPMQTAGLGEAFGATILLPYDHTDARAAAGTGLARTTTSKVAPHQDVAAGVGAAGDATAGARAAFAFPTAASAIGDARRADILVRFPDSYGFTDSPDIHELYDPAIGTYVIPANLPTFTQTDPTIPSLPAAVISSNHGAGVGASVTIPSFRALGIPTLVGDTIVLAVEYDMGGSSSRVPTVPSEGTTTNFNLTRRQANSNNDGGLDAWIKVAWDDEPSSYHLTFPVSLLWAWSLLLVRSPSGQLSLAGGGSAQQTTLTSTFAIHPTSVPDANDVMLLVAGSTTGVTISPPTGFTLIDRTLTSNAGIGVFDRVYPVAGVDPGNLTISANGTAAWQALYIWFKPPNPPVTGYSGWFKLTLPTAGDFTFDTFGSQIEDTKLAIFSDPPPAGPGGLALFYNDDTSTEPYASTAGEWFWSSIPADLAGGNRVHLEAGTYWIAVWPAEGPTWNPSLGTAQVRIRRLTGGPTELIVPPPKLSPIRVIFEHLGDIAADVVWSQTELETALGGNSSSGVIVVRDIGPERDVFELGQRVWVDLGPGTRPIWSGYLWHANRRFWFPVDKPDALQRQWRLMVVDIAILFGRRIAYNQANPAKIRGPLYLASTYDDVVIAELVDNWLDLTADDLDVTSQVHRVAPINYGEPTYPINGGMTFGEVMHVIAQLPAAAYGINPSRQLVYADVDDRNVPFFLSDTPGLNRIQYREAMIIRDGSQLVTEVFAWGAGKGSDQMVFKHLRSSDSVIAEHGLWQDAVLSFSIWKQATIDQVATSVVVGSPTSLRGHQNDRVEIHCVIYEHGIVVGDRVRYISEIWGYDDIIPVRKVHMTFPTPYDVRYELTLSHEIDEWGFEDPPPPIPGFGSEPPQIAIPGPIVEQPCISVVFYDSSLLGSSSQFYPGGRASGPFSLLGGGDGPPVFSGNWQVWKPVTGTLFFPGFDEPHVSDGSLRLNRVSTADIGPEAEVTVRLTALDGHGLDPQLVGLMGPDLNTNSPIRLNDDIPLNTSFPSGLTSSNWIYIWNGGTYNPALTGAGTYSYDAKRVGSSSDSWSFDGTTRIGTWTIVNNSYGTKLPYSGQAPWNRDVVTGRFRFQFNFVPSGPSYYLELRYGAASVRITPADAGGELRLMTDGGATATPIAMLGGRWYIAEIALDLIHNTTRVRLWLESAPGSVTELNQLANFERAGVGSYEPFLGVWMNNPTGTPITLSLDMSQMVSNIYAPANVDEMSMGLDGTSSSSGWGVPWVTYYSSNSLLWNQTGADPGITWTSHGSTGTYTVNPATGTGGGWIQRPLPTSDAVDLAFSIFWSGTSGPQMFFWLHGNRTTNAQRYVVSFNVSDRVTTSMPTNTTGTPTNTSQASLYGSGTRWFTSTTNVRISANQGGIRVRFWMPDEPEPDTWFHQQLFDSQLFSNIGSIWPSDELVWGILPASTATSGNMVTIGPVRTPSGDNGTIFLKSGQSVTLITSGVKSITPASSGWGFSHGWTFGQAPAGYSWAHTFSGPASTYSVGGGGPSYALGMASPEFTPDGQPMWPESLSLQSLSLALPVYHYENGGVEIPIKVRVKGEITALIQSSGIFGPGGPYPGSLTARRLAIMIKGFQKGPTGDGLPPDYDYGVYGLTVDTISTEARWGPAYGSYDWVPFDVEFTLEAGRGITRLGPDNYILTWGVEIQDIFGEAYAIGPYAGNFTPSGMTLSAGLRNVIYEIALDPDFTYPAQIDPCTGEVVDITLTASGTTDGSASRLSSTVYQTRDVYVATTLQVWKNGFILRWGIDFTETDPATRTFTFASPVLETDVISVRYNVEIP